MEYAKIIFTKITGLYVILKNCTVTSDLACPLENLVVFHRIFCGLPLNELEINPHKVTWLCGLDIDW